MLEGPHQRVRPGIAGAPPAAASSRLTSASAATDDRASPVNTGERKLALPSTSGSKLAHVSRIAFWTMWLLVLCGTAWLASVNKQPGGWDSLAVLVSARNIAEGRGFVTDFVPNYVERYSLPGRELTRPPGMSYLLGGAFRMFGVSLSRHVWVNGIIVLLTAWLLRAAIRLDGGDWWADVAGMSMLVIHPPLVQAWNSGALMLATAAMLALAVLAISRRVTGVSLAVLCAIVTAAGFFMKQTFVLSGAACTALLLLSQAERTWRQRMIDGAIAGVAFLALTSPYWLTNLLEYGEPLYSPINRFHWPTRYGVYPWYEHHRAVLFDKPFETFGSIIDRLGLVQVFRSELNYMRERAVALVQPNPFLLVPAVLGVILFRRRDWRIYAAVLTLTISPLFDTMYWMVEPRYLLPLFPCLLFLGWLAVRNYREWARGAVRSELRLRVSAGFTAVLVGAALHAAVMGWPPLRQEIDGARMAGTPGWKTILEQLPSDVVVMSDLPPAVSWWTSRKAIVTPIGDRADLLAVLRLYKPQYYLELGTLLTKPPLSAWSPGELERVAAGPAWTAGGSPWTLDRIRVTADGIGATASTGDVPSKDLTK